MAALEAAIQSGGGREDGWPGRAGPNVSRYSMPFFMHPTSATPLDVLPGCIGDGAKFAPITAGAFLAERLREIGLKK